MIPRYDYVIVGGGSAGCVLANRLSENPECKVLVIEAGQKDHWWDLFIHMPAALTIPIGNKRYDWCYESEPEPHMGGRRVFHARGKVLGGSSSINGMIFQRGNPLDYEKWAKNPGLESWSYKHCLPYFKKMETCIAGGDSWRGDQGPLKLERGPGTNPLFDAFLKATVEAGYPLTDDVNGFRQEGFALFDRNVYKGKRLSAARAYFHPVAHRKNLSLKTGVLSSRLVMQGERVTGIEYLERNGNLSTALAGEVILCAGAINSPQILQLSGIGDPEHLESVGVRVRHKLPGVGENLQDHLEVYVQHLCKKPVSMNPAMKWWRKPDVGLQWLFRKGPAATNHFEAGGFLRSNDDVTHPNLMFHFLPLAVRYDGSAPSSGHGYQVHVGPMFSDAKGHVKISSQNPAVHPKLVFNYLSTDQDRREWVEAIRLTRRILSQESLSPYNGGEISPGPDVQTDQEILDWVAKDAETALHPSCTCKMGTDQDAVTDPESLKVHGLSGLRVVDASVMPSITNGNIYAPVIMIAEKASDLILGQTPLSVDESPYYCYEPEKNVSIPTGQLA